ncbi:MAG TPA: acetyl-CoA carboxylase biotin carboxyl carrier protein [Pyrinomonadaceae bacterium]|jgi:acetyl-CoA carboxylase biotin carboxyl carrier protein|nr:acetyl-CoA carboxylase biotin carboxyl carrier protein [Pyrinomonadaceae bacterium]
MSDENQPQGGTGAAAAPQVESGSSERGQGQRHGRGRRRSGGGGRPEQRQPQGRRAEPMLNLDEVRELTELFSEHGLTDFEFENADIRIRLSRNPAPSAAAQTHAAQPTTHAQTSATATAAQQQPEPQPAKAEPTPEPEEELHIITSPIVGTFYRSPSPEAEAFVKAGSHVEVGTVVCIIEAMKLMNEIESDAVGSVTKIYVENGQPVEYGQPLFGVKK